jgi:uncharacterized SAM-binding protein YcdF (DUF218 family)
VIVVTATPVVQWAAQAWVPEWPDTAGDVLIVIGGGMYSLPPEAPVATEGTQLRALAAVWLWRQHGYRTIYAVGGDGTAESIRLTMMAAGVPDDRIRTANRSRTTRENAEEVRREIGSPGRLRLVLLTSDFHCRRARGTFAQVGLATVCFPAPDVLKRAQFPVQRWPCFWLLADEGARLARYWWKGWI